jgi:aminopeptidase YwaD
MIDTIIAEKYLQRLCQAEDRRMGSEENRLATDFFAEISSSFGWRVEIGEFKCMDWSQAGVRLVVNGAEFSIRASPYSLGCQVKVPLVAASSVEELEKAEITGKLLLLHGAITKEQLMAKNFPFYNPDEHKHIIHLLETKKPAAIIAATFRNPELAGAVYPFPLIEDGDFDIPSVYMTDVEGEKLALNIGEIVELESQAWRISSTGCNVIARKGEGTSKRIVLTAHIDTKIGTPGALDNAGGAVTLLLMAEALKDYGGTPQLEIALLNGEDYYASSGEILYLNQNQGKLDDILLAVNMDGAGSIQGKTAYSLYGCGDELAGVIRSTFASHEDLFEGETWYQSDHMIFAQNNVPAVAITSGQFAGLWEQIAHTSRDRMELVDPSKLIQLANALGELVLAIKRI